MRRLFFCCISLLFIECLGTSPYLIRDRLELEHRYGDSKEVIDRFGRSLVVFKLVRNHSVLSSSDSFHLKISPNKGSFNSLDILFPLGDTQKEYCILVAADTGEYILSDLYGSSSGARSYTIRWPLLFIDKKLIIDHPGQYFLGTFASDPENNGDWNFFNDPKGQKECESKLSSELNIQSLRLELLKPKKFYGPSRANIGDN